MKSNSNIRPAAIEAVGNGSYHYNYNITETIKEEDGRSVTTYDYNQVIVWDDPSYQKIVKAVIREEIDESEEFDLVNSYNAFKEGLTEDDSAKTKYIAYLNRLASIKAMVKEDVE